LVISRNSSFAYKRKSIEAKQIAEKLGVRYLLEGSVRKAGEQVRINAQLIDATTDHHLWAERYDGKMDNIFGLQDKITQKIVAALAVKLAKAEQKQLASRETSNIAAYDAFLKGMDYLNRHSRSAKTLSYFEKAIKLDPNYRRAYAGLARAYDDASWLNLFGRLGLSFQESSPLDASLPTIGYEKSHGRIKEARKTLEPLIKYYAGRGVEVVNLRFQMYLRPFKDKEVEKRYADGLIKAGLPGEPGGYYKCRRNI
jgi:tetratricopeptide (TPR) repeat protein